jgi:hypothetical protein
VVINYKYYDYTKNTIIGFDDVVDNNLFIYCDRSYIGFRSFIKDNSISDKEAFMVEYPNFKVLCIYLTKKNILFIPIVSLAVDILLQDIKNNEVNITFNEMNKLDEANVGILNFIINNLFL